MNITVEDISPVEKKVAVEIEWPFVARKLDDAYRELGRGVQLKGFRKGKVPRAILERMFAQRIEQEVTQSLVQESFASVAQQHSLAPVAAPVVDDIHFERGADFRYSARVEVLESFEPKDYFDVELEREAAVVSDEEVERALRAQRHELAEYKKIEGRAALQAGDVAYVDYTGTAGQREVKRSSVVVEVGGPSEGALEALPGLGLALVGVPLDAKDYELAYTAPTPPTTDGEALPAELRELSGAEVRLRVSIGDSRERTVPALDDDFAKDTGEADSLAELRDKTRDKLRAAKERQLDQALRSELVKRILVHNPFQVPPALVEQQAAQLVRRARIQLAMRGVNPELAAGDEQNLREQFRDEATEELRSAFLVEAVARKEHIEVTEAELEKALAELAQNQGKNTARLKAELQKEDRLDEIKHQIRVDKTLDLLVSRANIKVK